MNTGRPRTYNGSRPWCPTCRCRSAWFRGRVNVRGLHAELHEVAGDGLWMRRAEAHDRRGVFQSRPRPGSRSLMLADMRIHLIRRLGERVVHLDAGDFRPFAQVARAAARHRSKRSPWRCARSPACFRWPGPALRARARAHAGADDQQIAAFQRLVGSTPNGPRSPSCPRPSGCAWPW